MLASARVVMRAESMEAAEREALILLDHLRLAGLLEGLAGEVMRYGPPHFENVQIQRSMSDGPEPWAELGLPYLGRMSFEFEPSRVLGGLMQHGIEVTESEPLQPTLGLGWIALPRQVPAVREHSWEVDGLGMHLGETAEAVIADLKSIRDVQLVAARIDTEGRAFVHVSLDGWEDVDADGDSLLDAAVRARKIVVDMVRGIAASVAPEATAEEILDNIRRLVNVDDVEAGYDRTQRDGSGWRVTVTFKQVTAESPPMALSVGGATLREAALDAYGGCGVEVTHYDTVPLVGDRKAAAERIAGV
jgi:hypothetical protein